MTDLKDAPPREKELDQPSRLLRELTCLAEQTRGNLDAHSFGQGVHPIPGNRLLIFPRAVGDSRYPYVHDGMNFWVYGSGYMHANNGLFALFPRRTEGQEPGIVFMAATAGEKGWLPFSLLGVPHTPEDDADPADRFAVFAPACAWYITRKKDLAFLVRVFPISAHEVSFCVHVENEGSASIEILLSSFFNPMLRHQIHETDEDRWFRRVNVEASNDGDAAFLFHVNEDKDRHTSLSQEARIERRFSLLDKVIVQRIAQTPSRQQYMGSASRSLANALSLRTGTFGPGRELCTFTEPAIAADLGQLTMSPGGCVDLDYRFRVMEEHGSDVAERNTAVSVESALRHREQQTAIHADALSLQCHDSQDTTLDATIFNKFFRHLMKQVEFCSLIRGYVQLSENSLIGIRDIFQALEALAYWRPDAAREKMLEALAFTLEDGRCLRQYSLPNKNGDPGRADVRPFIDQGLWVISTIATYVRLTGDTSFLSETCGYHRIANDRVVPSSQSDTVLEHLRRILHYLLRNLDARTGCLRALYGDWNDALDGLGTNPGEGDSYGSGVSVMASLQLLQNLQEMRELLGINSAGEVSLEMQYFQAEEEKLAAALWQQAVHRALDGSQRIVHGWGHEGAYNVGSFRDADGVARDSLTSNAFWVLCGMMERHPQTRESVLGAFKRLDSKYGLRTFQPHFPSGDRRFGRIGKLPAGTAENAGAYIHATAFGIMALFEMGEARLAWEQLTKILPFTALHENMSHSPFVMPNSYGNNPTLGIDGQNMNDWQTGSSNVVLKTILRHMVGVRMEWDELVVRPANWCPFRRWETALSVRGRGLVIRYENKSTGARTFELNGSPQSAHFNSQEKAHGTRLKVENFPNGATLTVRISE